MLAVRLLSTSVHSSPDLKINDQKCDGVVLISHSLNDIAEHKKLRPLHSTISEYFLVGVFFFFTVIAVPIVVIIISTIVFVFVFLLFSICMFLFVIICTLWL